MMVNDMKPAVLKPLAEVRQTIIEKLQKESASEILNVEIDNLRKKYRPENLAQQEVLKNTRTAEQLWQIAQAEDAAYTRILYFRELVARYPQHKLAPQALFMIGFVYSEELEDLVQARKVLRRAHQELFRLRHGRVREMDDREPEQSPRQAGIDGKRHRQGEEGREVKKAMGLIQVRRSAG